MQRFHKLIERAMKEGFSDVHITGGHPLAYRSHGDIQFDPQIVYTHAQMDDLVRKMLNQRQLNLLRRKWSVDFSATSNRLRLRINVFKTTRGLSMAIRLLSGTIPTLEQLNMHPSLRDFCKLSSGLLLICGPTGSGKSTTIASLVNEIIDNRHAHVVTLEDPIEYRFVSSKSFVEQRELGTHIQSFDQGLIDVLREDPDVIVVGELREAETIRLTLNAAESGHLVIATLHASNVEDAIYRICNSFPSEAQEFVRNQLSSSLAGMVIQHLVYLDRARFRVPVLSVLRTNLAIKGLIRENRFSHIENTMLMSRKQGMFTHDQYLNDHLEKITAFSPPSKVFRPTVEVTPEPVYESPLTMELPEDEIRRAEVAPITMSAYEVEMAVAPAESESAGRRRVRAGVEIEEVFGRSYNIEEEEDLATLTEKLNNDQV